MASVCKIKIRETEYIRITDTSSGKNIRYSAKIGKYNDKQWLSAHRDVMESLSLEDKQMLANRSLKRIVEAWLDTPKEGKTNAKYMGIKAQAIEARGEASLKGVVASYLSDFCRGGRNTASAIIKAKRQCGHLLEFFTMNKISMYNQIKRDIIATYPEWRESTRFDGRVGNASADTVNQELNRLGAIIRHGVKFCGCSERYLLDGMKVKHTPQNTKAIRPFEIGEVKSIMAWLRDYSRKFSDWHLHDMILLALCSGIEAKALTLLKSEWFKMDLGILRVFDKLVSGVIDAKTQNRARDIPLTPTLRKIFERGYIFNRITRTHRKSAKGGTDFRSWAESALGKAESETRISDINLHRFRHTCATARLSAGWQLVRVSRMLGHSNIGTTASHYAEFDLSASTAGFEGMMQVYGDFVRWLDCEYFN